MPRVVHFDITADQPERAVKFYTDVFGWKINKWEGPMEYWMISTGEGPGIDGGLMKGENRSQRAITIDVQSVDEFAKKIEQSGGKITGDKNPIPGYGWLAFFKDTEGNELGIMQNDKDAK